MAVGTYYHLYTLYYTHYEPTIPYITPTMYFYILHYTCYFPTIPYTTPTIYLAQYHTLHYHLYTPYSELRSSRETVLQQRRSLSGGDEQIWKTTKYSQKRLKIFFVFQGQFKSNS